MKRVLALLLCALLVLSLSACKKAAEDKNKKKDAVVTTTTAATPTTTESTEAVARTYAHNEVINRFFVRFMEVHNGKKLDPDTINRGKEDINEYTAVINDCTVTVKDVSKKQFASGKKYALQITIVGGKSDVTVERMLDAFALIGVAADPGLSLESAEAAAQHLATLDRLVEPCVISERVFLQSYTADVANDACHMDLFVMDPLATDDTTTASPTTTTTE